MKVTTAWKGPEVRERIVAAEVTAVQRTVDATAERARGDHGWRNRTGEAERSITSTPAERRGEGTAARVGFGAEHGVFLERADRTIERAAEREFPELGERIRRELT